MKTIRALAFLFVSMNLSLAVAQDDPSMADPNLAMKPESSALPKELIGDIKSASGGKKKKTEETKKVSSKEIDSLYKEPQAKPRAPASEIPDDLAKDFVVSAPDRAPANASKSKARRSRLPAQISDGFELRARYQTLNSMFWVIKREDRYSLIYSNSTGSKATHDLSWEAYNSLYKVANGFKAFEGNISKCKDSSIQMHVISSNKERTVTTCLNGKDKSAEGLRNLGNMLAAMVR